VLLKKLGKYEILQWLGGGRFGDVFLARDTIIDRNFALKIARMRREEIAMLKDEARLLASLDHPNIVRFYNIDFVESRFVLVMEYIEGNNLRDMITEGGIDVEESVSIATQITGALVYAHLNNVLHRDLKPENILITDNKKPGFIKITDFGLAKFIKSGSISASSAGTPIYMAPEAWSGSFSDKSDIWSLGIILYEMLTGAPPFLDDSLDGLKRKIAKAALVAPAILRHDIPEYLEEIILASLASDPRSRPDAREIFDKIEQQNKGVRAVERVARTQKKIAATQFTPVQNEILESLTGPVLVLGQAGCGKTTILTAAVSKLLSKGVPVSRILVCTFTNKSANDIREKLLKHNRVAPHDLWAGTFHTIGYRMLRRDAERLDISSDFVIKDARSTLDQMQISVGKYRMNAVSRFIETLKAKGVAPEKFKPQNAWERVCHDIYLKYQQYSRENNILDYEDLILHSNKLLEDHSDIRQYYQKTFDYIFVDELQDISPAQYKLIGFIYKDNVFFTGDEDQAIYSWRGAQKELIYRVPRDYPDVKTFGLNQSFRLTQSIVDIANNLMRREATIMPNAQSSDVFVYAAKSEKDEADYVIKETKSIIKEKFAYGDIVILCRMNHLALIYQEALARAHIPHALISGLSLYERADVKPMIDYLEILEEGHLKGKDRDTFIARANNVLKIPKKYASRAAQVFGYHFADLRLLEPKKLIDDIIDLTGIAGLNADELLAIARDQVSGDLASFLNQVRLIQELDLVDWAKDVVRLMTIHSAKGLEFPIVFVVDLVEDVFPLTKKMSSPQEIEEERRLCYVALTRAQKRLYLLYPKWRRGHYQHPSRFLVEMFKTTA
jgi:DNA helicase-2/ATP-dependent DNA helicase PcrA